MDFISLLNMSSELGYQLAMCGAETFRVEEAVLRTMHAYHQDVECFSIPNLLIITINVPDGKPITRIRRIGHHGNDMDGVEKYSNLSRKICDETPDPSVALQWVQQTGNEVLHYGKIINAVGGFLGAAGFCMFFGGGFLDTVISGLLGILIGIVTRFSSAMHGNPLFNTAVSAYIMSLLAYVLNVWGIAAIPNTIIIGALMLLVPGLLITNAMRDMIFGDTNSGINRIVQVLLIALAIAIGTAAALTTTKNFIGIPSDATTSLPGLGLELIASVVGCAGFAIFFNIHGFGSIYCVLGGAITWMAYRLAETLGASPVAANFWGSLTAAVFSEIMARIRKYPAISYLVVSIFPLLPGAGIYYTMLLAVNGDMAQAALKGIETASVAGALAIGILLVSTIVRMWTFWKMRHRRN